MIVGIDLGTTNSAVALWRDGAAQLVPNALGDFLTPSAVSVDASGHVLVGQAARDRQATHPQDSVSSFKRYMGAQRTVRLGKRDFSAEDLSALVLKSLKADVEAFAGEPVSDAVITVPAYFNDRQRKATRRAGELAGFNVRRLINEPTAAALAFGVHDRQDREPFLVFDLGGGTFDVSIVEMFDGIIEVRASAGDNVLGGDDFNQCLVALVRPQLHPADALEGLAPDLLEAQLLAAAEQARRRLTDAAQTDFALVLNGARVSAPVDAAAFEAAAEPLIDRLREPVLRSLRDSRIAVQSLSEIVLVGGATRMPVVRRAITRMFGRFPDTTVHPDHAVALGAAVQAGLIERNAGLDEIRLTDVCPFTLGVDTSERDRSGHFRHGLFSPIIDRNTAIPVSRVANYTTIADNQSFIEFGIYQGEAREVVSNVRLGSIKVPVPPRPAGHVSVDCRFSYDSSGLLEVDVTVAETGVTRNLVILDESDGPSDKDIAARRAELAKLKFHPREEAENVALLARAQRAYEAHIGDDRARIGAMITDFEGALESQDGRIISQARVDLREGLDLIDRDRWL